VLQLLLLIDRKLVSILEEFDELFLGQFNISVVIILLVFDNLVLLLKLVNLIVCFRFAFVVLIVLDFFNLTILLLLLHHHLFLLCFEELLLLLVNLFVHLLLLLQCGLSLGLHGVLLNSRIHDVLTFSFFLLRWDLIDDLLLVLCLHYLLLLHVVLIFI